MRMALRWAKNRWLWQVLAAVVPPLAIFLAGPALAQQLNIDLGGDGGGSSTGRLVQLTALLTVLSLAPSILIMMTSFTRIVVVLSFLRTALGVQQAPPNTVLISLALFLTGYIMAPVLQQSYEQGIAPLLDEQITEVEAFGRATAPFKTFMLAHTREQDLMLFVDLSGQTQAVQPQDLGLHIVIPAFMISELKRAFEIGFLLFLPFLIIDLVVASVLMALGMMMLPPSMVAMPFKIIFFVLVDGWYLLAGTLVKSYATAAPAIGAATGTGGG